MGCSLFLLLFVGLWPKEKESRQHLGLEDVLHEDTLVLELVALGLEVQLVVQVLVNLLGLPVAAQQAAEDALATHPDHLDGHTRIGRTLALTRAHVPALAARLQEELAAGTRVHRRRLLQHQTILDQLLDRLAWRQRRKREK